MIKKVTSEAATHQHVHIEHPAVFSSTDTQTPQVQAVFVVEHFVEGVTQLHAQLFTSSAFKLRGCIGRTSDRRRKQYNKVEKWQNITMRDFIRVELKGPHCNITTSQDSERADDPTTPPCGRVPNKTQNLTSHFYYELIFLTQSLKQRHLGVLFKFQTCHVNIMLSFESFIIKMGW